MAVPTSDLTSEFGGNKETRAFWSLPAALPKSWNWAESPAER